MKKILSYILAQLKYFFLNPFWTSWIILVIIVLGLGLNGYIWYFYLVRMQALTGLTPVGYASGVLLLNIFLADISYQRQVILSWILLSTAVLIQIIFIVFLKFSIGG